jgi:hypothetical protein
MKLVQIQIETSVVSEGVEAITLPIRNHFALCALVRCLFIKRTASERNYVGALSGSGSFDGLPLVAEDITV